MREMLIHRAVVTAEAESDYIESVGGKRLDKGGVCRELSEYISRRYAGGRFGYFRVKHIDEAADKTLMLFVYRAARLGIMQFWEIRGICEADDWSEDTEESGLIRLWLKSKVEKLGKGDWVIEQAERAEADRILMGWTVCGTIVGMPKEARDAIEYGGNKTAAQK